MKAETTADLITYGGASFAASLMGERLIDDLYLFVNPVAIGAGRPIFNAVGTKLDLTLMHLQPFDCGITALHHQPALR